MQVWVLSKMSSKNSTQFLNISYDERRSSFIPSTPQPKISPRIDPKIIRLMNNILDGLIEIEESRDQEYLDYFHTEFDSNQTDFEFKSNSKLIGLTS